MRLRILAGALATAVLLALPVSPVAATTAPTEVQKLARLQTKLLLKFYEGQNVSPPKCGAGQGPYGIGGTLLLPVASYGPGDQTLNCKTRARSVFVDLGGFTITEDKRFPKSSYELNDKPVPFTKENLEPICDDFIAKGSLGNQAPAILDAARTITGPVLNSGVFTARVNRQAQIPGGDHLYADSVALGHPGRLATVFCGYKAKVRLRPGTHTIVVDYSVLFGGKSTVFTYKIKVKGGHHSHR